jgi:uncharacterized membrane protein YphA (DoxX/SURF4 family)
MVASPGFAIGRVAYAANMGSFSPCHYRPGSFMLAASQPNPSHDEIPQARFPRQSRTRSAHPAWVAGTHDANELSASFPDPLGVGTKVSLLLAVFAEVLCAALLVVGFLARFAALSLAVTMGVAFLVVHKAALAPGPASGELAFVYLAGFLALVFTGAGRYSVDGDD